MRKYTFYFERAHLFYDFLTLFKCFFLVYSLLQGLQEPLYALA